MRGDGKDEHCGAGSLVVLSDQRPDYQLVFIEIANIKQIVVTFERSGAVTVVSFCFTLLAPTDPPKPSPVETPLPDVVPAHEMSMSIAVSTTAYHSFLLLYTCTYTLQYVRREYDYYSIPVHCSPTIVYLYTYINIPMYYSYCSRVD
jgi:hypothetical protein